jgi:hypothetical protein
MNTRARFVITAAVIALAGSTSGAAASPKPIDPVEPSMSSASYGLYRDMDGGLWCGGQCMSGQRCCSITMFAE